jgi:hypothetical protein
MLSIKSDRLVPPKRQTRNTHSRSYQFPSTSSDYRKGSFFPRNIREWNALPPDIVAAKAIEAFKARVSKIKYILIDVKRKFLTVYSTILIVHTNSFFLDRKIFAAHLKVPGIINSLMVASIRQK